jgi:hypothetical protein
MSTKMTRRRPRESSEEPILPTPTTLPMHESDNYDNDDDAWQSRIIPKHGSFLRGPQRRHTQNQNHTHNTLFISISAPQQPPSTDNNIFLAHGCLLVPVAVAVWWYWTKRAAKRVYRRLTTSIDFDSSMNQCAPSMNVNRNMRPFCVPSVLSNEEAINNNENSNNENSNNENNNNENNNNNNENNNNIGNINDDTETTNFDEGSDKFNTWEDVLENETQDPSLRFVRWIKGKNYKAKRRMEAVSRYSLRRRNGSNASNFGDGDGLEDYNSNSCKTTPMLPVSSSDENASSDAASASIPTTSPRSTWQCIQDTGVEICSVPTNDSSDGISIVLSTMEILEHSESSPSRSVRSKGGGAFS